MPHYKKQFPGKYLQTADLDRPIVATIERVTSESFGVGPEAESRPVAYFKEAGLKGLVLNITRCEAIATIADSADTDDWADVRVRLTKGETRYQGKRVGCIVVGEAANANPL